MRLIAGKKRAFWWVFLALVGVCLIVLSLTAGKLVEWLWMKQLGFVGIFWRLLFSKLLLFVAAFLFVFFYWWVNFRQVARVLLREAGRTGATGFEAVTGSPLRMNGINLLFAAVSCGPALIFGFVFWSQWDAYLRFSWGGPVGSIDPIFGLDIGFYLFRLPFYEVLQNSLVGLTAVTLVLVFLAYYIFGLAGQRGASQYMPHWGATRHTGILFVLFLAAWAWGYYLDRYELMFSSRGVVFGPGYADYNVVRIVLWIMLFVSAALGLFTAVSLLLKRFRWILIGVGTCFALMIVLLYMLPFAIQKFVVRPNELELETPFLKHNIAYTRRAYQLDRVEEKRYPALGDLTLKEISQNEDTIRNIRLWDWRPLRQTFRQTQEIRLYYEFYEVDTDRYHLEGEGYRQVMLSARELVGQLPEGARTWINERLQFTHGYGVAMAFVSEQVEGGLPRYVVKDLPPASPYLQIDRPAIYYGEMMPGYRIVNTQIKEFDYPKGDDNVYTNYEGTGGVQLDTFWRRLLFAWDLFDINILISSYITPESRIQIWRRVQERMSRIAPFLRLDKDPYIVIVDGKLYWIQDAYTVSSHFPYSEPYKGGINYIRNSVKIIVDAYNGTVSFYVMDPHDPVLAVYRRLFPNVFQGIDRLPVALKDHLRYPQDLFEAQVDKFQTYHMTDPQVFYNREDLWTLPQEKYAGTPIPVEPYYILMRLPGERTLQYLLMTPLTPRNKDNMIAWMAARCDFPEYGQLLAYQLPKERLIYGPLQIEAMIDQDDVISQQLSLWDQRGSRVIRGNLLVIPVDQSFIYVEPVFLVAEKGDIPQLKRVIIVYGEKVVMEPTIGEAIEAVFGVVRRPAGEVPAAPETGVIADSARRELERAQNALGRGNWAEFGRAMDRLKEVLARPQDRSKSK